MIGRTVRQADHRDEQRQKACSKASHGLGKKTRGPDYRPGEQDYRGRVHEITILQQRVPTAQAVAYASFEAVFVLLARAMK